MFQNAQPLTSYPVMDFAAAVGVGYVRPRTLKQSLSPICSTKSVYSLSLNFFLKLEPTAGFLCGFLFGIMREVVLSDFVPHGIQTQGKLH